MEAKVIRRALEVSKKKGGQAWKINVALHLDIDQDTIEKLAASSLIIRYQRPLRRMTTRELDKLTEAEQVVYASQAGVKIGTRTREGKIARLENAGLSWEMAVLAVDNPEKFKRIMNKVDIKD